MRSKKYLWILAFLFFVPTESIAQHIRYYDSNGNLITESEHNIIVKQRESKKAEFKSRPNFASNDNSTKSLSKEDKSLIGYDRKGKPTNDPSNFDSHGRPHYDSEGRWITYPKKDPACYEFQKKCFSNCEDNVSSTSRKECVNFCKNFWRCSEGGTGNKGIVSWTEGMNR